LITFLAQSLAGLDAGIVELAALPDHDRARANQQNFLELVVPRHLGERTIDEFVPIGIQAFSPWGKPIELYAANERGKLRRVPSPPCAILPDVFLRGKARRADPDISCRRSSSP